MLGTQVSPRTDECVEEKRTTQVPVHVSVGESAVYVSKKARAIGNWRLRDVPVLLDHSSLEAIF